MNLKALLTLAFIFTFTFKNYSQSPVTDNTIITGFVLDKETNQPLAYVSIGVLDKPQGTVTDSAGHFSFSLNKDNLSDTLQISIVGYTTSRIAVTDFVSGTDKSIKLTQQIEQLAEVTITNTITRANTEIIGRQDVNKLVQVSVHNKKTADETIGSELGMMYKTKKENAILKDFNFYVSSNNFNYIKFRINVYSVKNEMPDTLICNKQIFATAENFKTDWIKIDLEPYNIKVKDKFIVTIQWIESRMDKQEKPITILPVSLTPFSKNCYARIASQDKWKKMGVNLSSFVTIAY